MAVENGLRVGEALVKAYAHLLGYLRLVLRHNKCLPVWVTRISAQGLRIQGDQGRASFMPHVASDPGCGLGALALWPL